MDGIQQDRLESDDQQDVRPPASQRIQRHLLRRMGRGFLVLIPLLITLLIVRYLVAVVEALFSPFVAILTDRTFIQNIPGAASITWAVVLILTLAFFYLLGTLATGPRWQNRVSAVQNAILSRIPVVKTIYSVAHQATEILSAPMQPRSSRVVFLEWPRPGIRAMGLVTGQCRLPGDHRKMLVVYIATVPNPTSGMLAVVPEDEVTDTDITVEDAMKVIFSGGIVLPEGMRIADGTAVSGVEQRIPRSTREEGRRSA